MSYRLSHVPPPSISVWLGDELRARLEAAAKQERRTLSDLTRIIIEDWLDERDRRQ